MRNNISELSKYVNMLFWTKKSEHQNSDSFTFKAAVTLKGNHRLVLTGTPIENSLKDLWAQFCFLQPDLLGSERQFHQELYSSHQARQRKRKWNWNGCWNLYSTPQQIRCCSELPSLTEEVLYCGMTEQQEELYMTKETACSILLHELEVESEKNFTIINGIMRLRQLACHPKLTLKDFQWVTGQDGGDCRHLLKHYEVKGTRFLSFHLSYSTSNWW